MKAAVVTLHRVYNYGSALQAYATQKVLQRQGVDVEIIDYITPQRTKKAIWLAGSGNRSGIKKILYLLAKSASIFLKERTFGRFVEKNLRLTKKYVTADDLAKDPPQADVYVTGSDQTWNSQYNEGVDRGFFLDFVPEDAKRVAFVSSFGRTELPADEVEITKKYIGRYSALSVREDSAVEILNGLGRQDAVQMIDPTLLLTKDEWVALASKRLIKERYLILMLLYNEDNRATEYARKLADQKGLKLVKICWDLRRPPMVDVLMTHRSPADFLSLFYHADFVVTNSFHGTAFSINLERQFVVVPRNEFNSRIESLLRLTGLEDRLVASEEALSVAEKTIDYAPINRTLDAERERAKEFIETQIKRG